MTLELRAVRTAELADVCGLLALAFNEAAPQMFIDQIERDTTFRLRHGRVAIVNDRVAGYVRIFARTMLVRGVPVAAGGIGSVATHPTVRDGGIATALLRDAIEQQRREGMRVAFLFTGITGFYERLGFRIVVEPYFEVSAASIRDAKWFYQHSVRTISYEDIDGFLRVYRRVTAGTTGAFVRTKQLWLDTRWWLGFPDGFAVRDSKGASIGYLFSRCTPFGHQILEAECLPGSEYAINELLLATARRDCPCGDRIVALAPDRSTLAAALRSLPSTIEGQDRHPMMVRTLDDDSNLDAAFDTERLHFWNTDRI